MEKFESTNVLLKAGMKTSFIMDFGSLGGKEKWDIEILKVNKKSIKYKFRRNNSFGWQEWSKSVKDFENTYGKYFI